MGSEADHNYIDLDKGFALAFLALLCLFLLAMIVRCARMVIDPYSAIPTLTWQEEQISN
ncbi:cortexin domain-containing 1-like [Carcharodon carcharias]|uniref:cortexin domain-containing 1-like n=1 Tax=Carcharodon carcharias TaxID=13397 RepID=UPI001B7EBE47|nr:cortexin domain-containing 1-like [Carcharodon carcharias]